MKAAILSLYMLNQPADEALTGADRGHVRTVCYLAIIFPASPGYLEKAEKMKIFHLCKKFFSLANVCAVLLKHYIFLKPYFTPNLLLEEKKAQGHTANIRKAMFSSIIILLITLGLHPSASY